MVDARTGRRPGSRETERKLIAAVIQLMQAGGLAACTAPAVAERAGVAVGTIYRRYPDKDALVGAAILDLVSLEDGEREADYAAFAHAAADLGDFFRRIAAHAVRVACQNRTLVLAVRAFARAAPEGPWRERFTAEQGRARNVIVRAAMASFGSEIRGGEVALRLSLAAVYGAVEAVWLEPIAGLFDPLPSPEAFVEGLVEMQTRFLN